MAQPAVQQLCALCSAALVAHCPTSPTCDVLACVACGYVRTTNGKWTAVVPAGWRRQT